MACPAVLTGQSFLGSALAHIDCQAQAIGAYGFGALASPGSTTSLALTGLLTVFIAIFGMRLLLGYPMQGRDLVGDLLRVAIVLTLATSWPAWRIVGYDLVINGPQQIVSAIGLAAQLPGTGGNLLAHLQRVDEGLIALNAYGSGRLGVAQGDWFQLGFARSAFLVGTLGPLALVKLMTGILLALAPLVAGLLLFGITRPIFTGWARGLVMVFMASIALTLVLGAELAMIQPWLQDALAQRAADTQILEAPTEVLVLTLAFALVGFGVIAATGWIAFHSSSLASFSVMMQSLSQRSSLNQESSLNHTSIDGDTHLRAHAVAMAVSESTRRDQRLLEAMQGSAAAGQTQAALSGGPASAVRHLGAGEALGSSYRRNTRRVSQSGVRRDSAT